MADQKHVKAGEPKDAKRIPNPIANIWLDHSCTQQCPYCALYVEVLERLNQQNRKDRTICYYEDIIWILSKLQQELAVELMPKRQQFLKFWLPEAKAMYTKACSQLIEKMTAITWLISKLTERLAKSIQENKSIPDGGAAELETA